MIFNPYNLTIGKIKLFCENNFPVLTEKYFLPFFLFCHDKLSTKHHVFYAKKLLENTPYNIFRNVEIETINRCNGSCSYCPASAKVDIRPLQIMEQELFESIIKQLSAEHYSGSLGLYSNNEPLLDNKLLNRLKQAREELPKAHLYLYTNGSLLTIEKFDEMMKYLDFLVINNYNQNLELNEFVEKIYNHSIEKGWQNRIQINLRKPVELLTNRGGLAQNRTPQKFRLNSPCMYPYEQMVIKPDGKISMCCSDVYGKSIMGDLKKEKLIDIWRGKGFEQIRQKMLRNRKGLAMCRDCDLVVPEVFVHFSYADNEKTKEKNKRIVNKAKKK